MRTSFVFVLMILLSRGVLSSTNNTTDILFNRSANFEVREDVLNELKQLLGKKQPLAVKDAIAEVCYNVDLCALSTSDSDAQNYCQRPSSRDPVVPTIGDMCHTSYFREKYLCKENIAPMNIASIIAQGEMLNDLGSLYTSLIKQVLIKKFSTDYGFDFSNAERVKQFFTQYPKQAHKVQTIATESYSLGSYTGNCYGQLNSILYSNDQDKIVRYYNLYKAIINTLETFPKYKGLVNRGTHLPATALEEHHKVGNIVCYKGFTSTAVHDDKTDRGNNPRNSFLNQKCVQRLYIKYEKNGAIAGKSIDSASLSSGENEVLFEPGSCFRIDSVSPRTDTSGLETGEPDCLDRQRFNFEMTLVPSK
jgi:hypothetical protein